LQIDKAASTEHNRAQVLGTIPSISPAWSQVSIPSFLLRVFDSFGGEAVCTMKNETKSLGKSLLTARVNDVAQLSPAKTGTIPSGLCSKQPTALYTGRPPRAVPAAVARSSA
jgi:hypothetical protein